MHNLSPLPQLWVKERMPLATSTDHGKDLPTVQLLIKKNQVHTGATDILIMNMNE